MSRGAAVKETEVLEVANALRASNQRVTAQALRNKLGRGSLTTMCRFLAKWDRPSTAEPCVDEHQIPDTVKQEFERIWRDTQAALESSCQVESEPTTEAKDAHARMAVSFLARKVVELEKRNSELESLLKKERMGAAVRNCFTR